MTQRRNSEKEDHFEPEEIPSGEERRASLYDDTLSEKKSRPLWVSIAWVLLFIAVIGGIFSTILTDSSRERITELAEMSRAEKENSPLAQKVREVREKSSIDISGQAADQGALNDSSGERSGTTASASSEDAFDPIPQKEPEDPTPESSAPNRVESAKMQASPSPVPASEENEQLELPAPPAALPESAGIEEIEDEVPDSSAEEPVEDEADLAAYRSLLEQSTAADQLVSGELATLEYRDWRVVQKTEKEIWIDLIAEWTSGSSSEVHLIWAVSREDGTVRPLSDAARTLDSAD